MSLAINVRAINFLAGVSLIALAEFASACRCPSTSFEVGFASSTAVALVEVLNTTSVPVKYGQDQIVDLLVHATWKGALSGRQKIVAGGPCGYWFRPGEQYLLYAHEWRGQMRTSLCSRTREYSRAEDELALLGPPKKTESKSFRLVPRESAGLSISVAPVKKSFTIFDDITFDLTFINKSRNPLLLPSRSAAANDLITLVVRKDGGWWTSLTGGELKPYTEVIPPLKPGKTRKIRLTQRGYHIRDIADYSVQAVVRYSTSTKGLWTGYVFSNPTNFVLAKQTE